MPVLSSHSSNLPKSVVAAARGKQSNSGNKENMGNLPNEAVRAEVTPAVFSPQSLAKYNMKQIEEELNALRDRQRGVFEEVKRSNQTNDEETFEQYVEFFGRWKEHFTNRVHSYKQQLLRQEMELTEFRDYSESLVRQLQQEKQEIAGKLRDAEMRTQTVLARNAEESEAKTIALQERNNALVKENETLRGEMSKLRRNHEESMRFVEEENSALRQQIEELLTRLATVEDDYANTVVGGVLSNVVDKVETGRLREIVVEVEERLARSSEEHGKQIAVLIEEKSKLAMEYEQRLFSMMKAEKVKQRLSARVRCLSSGNGGDVMMPPPPPHAMAHGVVVGNVSGLSISQSTIEHEEMPAMSQSNFAQTTTTNASGLAASVENVKKLEELKASKDKVKREIIIWCRDFEARERRKPSLNDRGPIRHLIEVNEELKAQIEAMEARNAVDVVAMRPPPPPAARFVDEEGKGGGMPYRLIPQPPRGVNPRAMVGVSANASFDDVVATPPPGGVENGDVGVVATASQVRRLSQDNAALRKELGTLRKAVAGGLSENETIACLKVEIAGLLQDKEALKEKFMALRRSSSKTAGGGGGGGGGSTSSMTMMDNEQQLHVKLKKLNEIIDVKEGELKRLRDELEVTRKGVLSLEGRLRLEIVARKKAHNEIEDMKGKIRVFCRVRPMSKSEIERGSKTVVVQVDSMTVNVETRTGAKPFSFDSCFNATSTQDAVFEEVRPLLRSFVDGYNVCLFAYGQTGSGKTYTMQGTRECPGITPRTVDELFNHIKELEGNQCTVELQANMVELYMDTLFDLLGGKEAVAKKGSQTPSLQQLPVVDVKEDAKGNVVLGNIVTMTASSRQDLEKVLRLGLCNRKTGKTDMNEESSRSHLILMLILTVYNKQLDTRTTSKLSLVDLAGSERATKANTTAKQLNEAKSINKSLTALGDVISALATVPSVGSAKQEKFIPYRNHKLTMLMKDSLGGTSKTLMFVNVSPSEYNVEETHTSMMYAARVKHITNDMSKHGGDPRELLRLRENVRSLTNERDALQRMLQEVAGGDEMVNGHAHAHAHGLQ